jgi:hypothetical protein
MITAQTLWTQPLDSEGPGSAHWPAGLIGHAMRAQPSARHARRAQLFCMATAKSVHAGITHPDVVRLHQGKMASSALLESRRHVRQQQELPARSAGDDGDKQCDVKSHDQQHRQEVQAHARAVQRRGTRVMSGEQGRRGRGRGAARGPRIEAEKWGSDVSSRSGRTADMPDREKKQLGAVAVIQKNQSACR